MFELWIEEFRKLVLDKIQFLVQIVKVILEPRIEKTTVVPCPSFLSIFFITIFPIINKLFDHSSNLIQFSFSFSSTLNYY